MRTDKEDGAGQREALKNSWIANAQPWLDFMHTPHLQQRRSISFNAVAEAALSIRPDNVLDVGCGEGWLCRALSEQGVQCVGLDASERLIEAARLHNGARYKLATYDQIISGAFTLPKAPDLVVANFSLLDDLTHKLLYALADITRPDARLLIQTVHPFGCGGDYRDGWRHEFFAGHGDERFKPMPWFFRTLASWCDVFGPRWRLTKIEEPRELGAKFPVSLLIHAARF